MTQAIRSSRLRTVTLLLIPFLMCSMRNGLADDSPVEPSTSETPAERGYRLLRTKPFLPPDFDHVRFNVLRSDSMIARHQVADLERHAVHRLQCTDGEARRFELARTRSNPYRRSDGSRSRP